MKHETPGYSGGETLGGAEVRLTDASILNFWQWAYSDLTNNVNRGVFAEWMVAKLLGIEQLESRLAWQPWDIETPNGVRIEVKAAAYVHAWTPGESDDDAARVQSPTVVFSSLRTHLWTDHLQRDVANDLTYNADLYVFCLQAHPGRHEWDGLDLGQWEFYVLPKSALEDHGTTSMRLSTVSRLSGGALSAGEFQKKAGAMIDELASSPNVKARKASKVEVAD
jgi:hypothetical protein